MTTRFLHDTKNKDALDLYHGLKRKHGLSLGDAKEFEMITDAIQLLRVDTYDVEYDIVYYPESARSAFLYQLAKRLGKVASKISKRSKYDIYRDLIKQDLMKDERTSLDKAMDAMGDTFKINEIKGNQRWRFKEIMFKPEMHVDHSKKILIVDDAVFSGSTIEAMVHQIPGADIFTIFSKIGESNESIY